MDQETDNLQENQTWFLVQRQKYWKVNPAEGYSKLNITKTGALTSMKLDLQQKNLNRQKA